MAQSMTIRLKDEFHKKIKIQATLKGMSITEYIIELVEADLKKGEQQETDK